LEKKVYYEILFHNYKQTSELQKNTSTETTGTSASETESKSETYGVSVTVEGGIDLGMYSAGVANVSSEFSFSSSSFNSIFTSFAVEKTIYTAAVKASTLWQKMESLTLKRHGSTGFVNTMDSWALYAVNSFVTDDFLIPINTNYILET
jgi:hypothetical protein